MADPIPSGYHTVTPYLRVTGAAELIEFLERAFGANENHRSLAPDGSIMHADVTIGDSHVMLTDGMENFPPLPGSNFLYVSDVDATYRSAIDAGATSMMEPSDQFYGDRTAGVRDPFGNVWWIGTHIEDLSAEELHRRHQQAMKERHRG
ncbi:MAG TPA: VOC family protein [Vicinamibacterales bacterium]|nr:VOC family protein [Vicinamibacterales bacterium]